ncbi:MAG: hypothetical protein KME60_09140 [Cyanomargarita calcarea GSE-NOS-MK-12-04C]|uniref:Uncharacterized protein n=1 Tax=Cyanomargarita calcarea GSE-NOS-MK-12-04C TaxID=2839659 RepID=A0A951QKI9_9CYAN|nr:hypothetical protein [Cyanomargarita calcarea GSE-NOS-MK-12-04C]
MRIYSNRLWYGQAKLNEGRRKKEEGRRKFLGGDWNPNSKRTVPIRSGS